MNRRDGRLTSGMGAPDRSLCVIVVYIPIDDAENVKQAMFDHGAGKLGLYENCSWQVEGIGQFKPLEGSNPTIGCPDELERVPEVRVEIICEESKVETVVNAMLNAHPYEEPAFHCYRSII